MSGKRGTSGRFLVAREEYIIGPRRVIRHTDKAMVLIPKALANRLIGKLVQIRLTVIEEEEAEGDQIK